MRRAASPVRVGTLAAARPYFATPFLKIASALRAAASALRGGRPARRGLGRLGAAHRLLGGRLRAAHLVFERRGPAFGRVGARLQCAHPLLEVVHAARGGASGEQRPGCQQNDRKPSHGRDPPGAGCRTRAGLHARPPGLRPEPAPGCPRTGEEAYPARAEASMTAGRWGAALAIVIAGLMWAAWRSGDRPPVDEVAIAEARLGLALESRLVDTGDVDAARRARRPRAGPAGRAAARLPGAVVQLARRDGRARARGLSRDRAGPARLQPLRQAARRRRPTAATPTRATCSACSTRSASSARSWPGTTSARASRGRSYSRTRSG